jgi:pimeloyl-ACP methyl ester carboxylesterase
MPSSLLRGGTIFARTWGASEAPAVLCGHGSGGSSLDFASVARELTERRGLRVIAIDAPGHGKSASRPAEAFRPSALAMLATEILDELGMEKTVFLGFSWGASVGCRLVAEHPERTLALALVEGGHLDFADLPDFRTDRPLDELISEAAVVASREGAGFGNYSPEVAGAMVSGLCREPVTATYPRIAAGGVPVLFIGAQRDEFSARAVQRLSRLVPQTKVVAVQSQGHELLRDAPSDVAREVDDWLRGLELPG